MNLGSMVAKNAVYGRRKAVGGGRWWTVDNRRRTVDGVQTADPTPRRRPEAVQAGDQLRPSFKSPADRSPGSDSPLMWE